MHLNCLKTVDPTQSFSQRSVSATSKGETMIKKLGRQFLAVNLVFIVFFLQNSAIPQDAINPLKIFQERFNLHGEDRKTTMETPFDIQALCPFALPDERIAVRAEEGALYTVDIPKGTMIVFAKNKRGQYISRDVLGKDYVLINRLLFNWEDDHGSYPACNLPNGDLQAHFYIFIERPVADLLLSGNIEYVIIE